MDKKLADCTEGRVLNSSGYSFITSACTCRRKRLRVDTEGARSDRVHAELAEDVLQLELGAGLHVLVELLGQSPARFSNEDHHGLHFAGSEDGGEGRSHLLPFVAVEAGQLSTPSLPQIFKDSLDDLFSFSRVLMLTFHRFVSN